ncbi:MAG: DUF4365 domain-containing protein [Planctomycetota bacterium]|nr:DUF4365 domain-containing protein [Planctomycetota bacterium]
MSPILPKILPNYFQERQGVLRVSRILNDAGLVFRETSNADIGIDGHVEFVNSEGKATGAIVAVQIKSGTSYLKGEQSAWTFYAEDKHIHYWEMYPLPVVLIIHDPVSDTVYWDDVRLTLRSDQHKALPLLIPKANVLLPDNAAELFANCGSSRVGLLSEIEALKTLSSTQCSNKRFPLSHLDIFLEGLTDIGRKLFFSAGMCWELAEALLPEDRHFGIGMGSEENCFLDSYLRFLVEQSIAHLDFSDIMIDLVHRQLHPTILVPLTARGRRLRDLCRELVSDVPERAITEASIGFSFNPSNRLRSIANSQVVKEIESHFKLNSNGK